MVRQSRKRRYLVVALPYIIVVGMLWLVNLSLPSIDPSLDIPFTRDIVLDGVGYKEINRNYLSPFFPAGSPLIPELKPTLLRKTRAPNSLRILCLGESSMAGLPFGMAATIPALVRKQLRRMYPDREIEVVNLGASAINTNVIHEMVPEFLSLEPDLILVYTGHNEFYGPEGIGASWIERQIPGLTPLKYRARRLPIVHLLQRWIAGFSRPEVDNERNLMRQVSGGAEIALQSPEAERIFRQFQGNLDEIVNGFRARGISVILGEISSNLMFPPFAPRPKSNPDPISLAIGSRRFAAAESLIVKGLADDSVNAYDLYLRGVLSLAEGDSSGAARFLERARDNDRLKFRAPGRINDIIHQVGGAESVPVLPIDSLLRARSPHGITDTTFFCEHLHPTFAGYDLIARIFVRKIVDQHLRVLPGQPAVALIPFDPDSLSVPRIDLIFGALSMRALTTHWPFTGMALRHDILDNCEEWELNIAREVYAHKLGWTQACLQYAENSRRHNKPDAMVTALSALVEETPGMSLFRYGLAAALEAVGRTSEAIEEFRRTITLRPVFPQANLDFGLLLVNNGQYGEAQQQLQTAFASPGVGADSSSLRAVALYGLAAVAANRDSIRSALSLLEQSLHLAPGYKAAIDLRSQILNNVQ